MRNLINIVEATSLLMEAFSNPLEYAWTTERPRRWLAEFKTENGIYVVDFDLDESDDVENVWGMGFMFRVTKPQPRNKDISAFGITGTGNAPLVFSTVVAIAKDFVERQKPVELSFSAAENSRVKLYKTMARLICADSDYTVEHGYPTKSFSSEYEFKLVRKETAYHPTRELEDTLAESFSQPLPFEWVEKASYKFKAVFNVEDVDYSMSFDNQDNDLWEISFRQMNGVRFSEKNQAGGYGVTGSGNASVVMSTVIACIRDFIKLKNPTRMYFCAEEPSRIKLYKTVASKLCMNSDYALEQGENILGYDLPGYGFKLTRNDASENG